MPSTASSSQNQPFRSSCRNGCAHKACVRRVQTRRYPPDRSPETPASDPPSCCPPCARPDAALRSPSGPAPFRRPEGSPPATACPACLYTSDTSACPILPQETALLAQKCCIDNSYLNFFTAVI